VFEPSGQHANYPVSVKLLEFQGFKFMLFQDDLIVYVMFFQFITKDERRKVIEQFFAYVKARYEDAAEKLKNSKDSWAVPLCLLEYGKPTLKNQIGISSRN